MRVGTPSLAVALKLARRELRGGLKGFRIFLACLALGVAAIASVQSVAESILAGLRDDGQAILGGDVSVRKRYSDISQEQRDYLQSSSTALTFFNEMRTMARPLDGDDRTMVELKAVNDNYPLVGQVELQDGLDFTNIMAQRDGQWGAIIEPALQDRLGVSVGDQLSVGDVDYQVRAIISREPDRIGSGGSLGFWPRVMVDLASLQETSLLTEGSMLYYQYRLQLPAGVDPTEYRQQLDAAFPDAYWRLNDYRNAAPQVERVLGRLTLFLTLVGLTALLVGGVGVSNAVKAFLDSKITTIASLKCLGATNRIIFQTYLTQLLILACGGIALGLLIGALAPPIAGSLLAGLLPIPISIGVYPSALLLAALFGLLTMLTFAIWPLARAHEIPAASLFRDAITGTRRWPRWSYIVITIISALLLAGLALITAVNKLFAAWFIIGALASIVAFRAAAGLVMMLTRKLRRPRQPGLRLALANLHRPGAATPNIVLSLGLGLTVLVAIALIEGNMSKQVQDSIPKQAPAYFFLDVQSDQIDSFVDLLNSVDGASNLKYTPYMRGRIVKIKGLEPNQALANPNHEWMIRGDRGITYASEPPNNADTVAGEWWPADYSGPPLLSVHKDVIQAFDLKLGDTVTMNVLGRDITGSVAHVRDLEWRTMQLNFAFMFSPEPLRSAPHGYIATVAADNSTAESEIQRSVTRTFPAVTTVRIKDALDKVNELMSSIGAAVRSIAAITLIAGTLVLAGAVAAGHSRRIYDSIVLKVLGATRSDVLRAFLLEYGLLGLITALIAAVIGTIASWAVLTLVMNSEWVFIPSALLMTILLSTAITLAFGFVGTWRALSQKAAPLLRND